MFAPALMTSAIVYIRDRRHRLIRCRTLLDTGASANFISESIIKLLSVHIDMHSSSINAINNTCTESRGIVRITIQSIHNEFTKDLTCLVIPSISDSVPSEVFPRNTIQLPTNIKLADPEFHRPRTVDLLIGLVGTLSMFAIGQINLSRQGYELYLQKTQLGWVVAGGTLHQKPSQVSACNSTHLDDLLLKFWSVEDVAPTKPRSPEDIESEEHFIKTVSRDKHGRYAVRLPFRSSVSCLGDSRSIALRRLMSLERKLNANAYLKSEYTRVIDEYLNLNQMSVVENPIGDGYFLPHHAVIKETNNTTKVRVVFDASMKTSNGVSLNDLLLTGPTIQSDLVNHLIRFRTYNYVITADIEKMYRQIWVHKEDRQYQR